jgi:hypothetical protein
VILDRCDYDNRHMVETQWIGRFPRADLLNRRKRRPYWDPIPPTRHRIAGIDNYIRRYKPVEGSRGIQYDSYTGYYRVLVYNGSFVHWLEGDELPCGMGSSIDSIWFSDLARALHARDKTQDLYRRLMSARRWEDIRAARKREKERLRTEGHLPWFRD